jgi:predicted nucleic acid-binding protein
MKYYIDTCIFLNVWKREVGPNKKKPFYLSAHKFLQQYSDKLLISTAVLYELEKQLTPQEFEERCAQLKKCEIISIPQDVEEQAKRIYQEIEERISMSDIIHMLLAEREGAILITRDRALIRTAKEYYITVKRPDDLVRY